jgi:dihydropteroate synthase
MQNSSFSTNKTLNVRGRLIDLSSPKVMGILNVTPDSFFDGNRYTELSQAIKQAERMIAEGATFIDVGGYSSRPGAENISEEEETQRVVSVIAALSKTFPEVAISIDTFRSSVAKAAINEGAGIINDISGGELDEKMFETVAELNVPYILMHMRGTPQTMTQLNQYENVIKEVSDYFHERIYKLQSLGVKDIIVDPGLGFAKSIDQNFEVLSHLDYFRIHGKPLLIGLSRKSMIWKTLHASGEEALNGTTSLNTVALLKGASILRVHDVKEAVEVVKLVEKLRVSNPF